MENKLVKSKLFGFFASLLKQIELRKLLNFKETMNHYKSLKLVWNHTNHKYRISSIQLFYPTTKITASQKECHDNTIPVWILKCLSNWLGFWKLFSHSVHWCMEGFACLEAPLGVVWICMCSFRWQALLNPLWQTYQGMNNYITHLTYWAILQHNRISM